MVAAVGLVIGFGSSSALAAAYGVAVATTMVITTLLIYVVMRERWKWTGALAMSVAGGFLIVDLAYFGANLFKIPDGGWFPLVIGLSIFTLITTWKKGRQLLLIRLRSDELSMERFAASVSKTDPIRVPGTAVYMFSQVGMTPPALLANLRHNEVLHERVIVLSVATADVPRVHGAQRAEVTDLGSGFYQVVLRYGFMEEPDVPAALTNITRQGFGVDPDETVYVLGRETVLATDLPGMAMWREKLFALMARNAMNAARYYRLPTDRTLEIGVNVEI